MVTYPDKDKAHEIYEYADELGECIFKLYLYQEYAGDEDMDDGDIDPTLVLAVLEQKAKEIEEYNTLCESIKGEEYDLFKSIWNMFFAEFKVQYENVKSTNWDEYP